MRDFHPSRRIAIAVGLAAVAALATSPAAVADVALLPNDAKLSGLGEALARTLAHTVQALQPVDDLAAQNARLSEAEATLSAMADIPADTSAGLVVKARAYLATDAFDLQNGYEVGRSLAHDVLRLKGDAQ